MNIRLLIIVSFFSILLADAINYLSTTMHISLDATYLIAALRLISLVCLLFFNAKLKWKNKIPPLAVFFFKCMILWNLVTIVRGAFAAEDYWDWKYLGFNSAFSMMIPYAIIVGVLFTFSEDLFTLIVTRLFVFGYLAIPLTLSIDLERELFPRALMITISFFVLIIPYVKLKWRLAIICVAATSAYLAYDFRTNILRILFALLVAGLYYARNYITTGLMKSACLVCIIIPPIFLVLGITNQYNIFKPTDDIDKYAIAYDNGVESNLATDTRTFLYQEVFSSMQANHSFIFGEGAAAKYRTEYFEGGGAQNNGRFGAEVGFLNTLLYSGIIGILSYALVLFSAIYYGITRSNNFFCKMLALFLAFRWIVFFIEDFTVYDTNYFFLWLSVGLCLSKEFRALTDADIKQYFTFSGKKKLVAQLS